MNGLLIKDFLVVKRRCSLLYGLAIFLFLIGAFFIFPSVSAIFVPILLAPMSVASLAELASSDEKSGWKNYLPVLPLTRQEIILTRYAFCGILIAATSIIGFIYGSLSVLVFGSCTMADILLASFGGLLFAILMTIAGVPAAYFCKGEVATATMMGIIVLAMIVRYSDLAAIFVTMNLWVAIPIILIALFLLTYASYRLSFLIYTRKIRLKDKGIIR